MSKFDDRTNDLIDNAASTGEIGRSKAAGPWMSFKNDSGEPVNHDESSEVSQAFDRNAGPAKDYADSVLNQQSFRKTQAAKLENDVLSALERDSRGRHRSRVRMMAHAAAKLVTHGQPAGPVGRAAKYIDDLKAQQ